MPLYGHEKQDHKTDPSIKAEPAAQDQEKTLAEFNETYLANIKPIFEKKCNTCHGDLQDQLERVEVTIGQLEKDSEGSDSVLDISSVFSLLKIFRSEFEQADISIQTEILRDFVSEILVKEESKMGFQSKVGDPGWN